MAAKLTEILEVDPEMLMEKLIAENEELPKLINLTFYAGEVNKLAKVELFIVDKWHFAKCIFEPKHIQKASNCEPK